MPTSLRKKAFLWLGPFLIVIGLACNQWLLVRLFSSRGDILPINRFLIWGFDLVAISSGVAVILYRKELAEVNRKSWILLLVSTLLSMLVLEFSSYLILRYLVAYHPFDDRSSPTSERLLRLFNTSSDILPYGVKSHYRQRFAFPEFQTEIHTNNVGFREERDFLGEKIDIAFVGDSFTFGHGVNFGERYSDLLRKDFPGKYIVSLSYPNGFAPPHYYLFLRKNPQYIPRVLVLGLCLGNDLNSDIEDTDFVFDANHELISAKSKSSLVQADGALGKTSWNWLQRVFHVLGYSHFGRVLVIAYGRQIGLFQAAGQGSSISELTPFYRGELDQTNLVGLQYIEQLKGLAEKNGSRFLVFLIPEHFTLGNYPERCPFVQRLCEELRDRRYLQAAVSKWLESHQIEFVDPTTRFISEESHGNHLYFVWDSHWNVDGHRVASSLLAERLKASPEGLQ